MVASQRSICAFDGSMPSICIFRNGHQIIRLPDIPGQSDVFFRRNDHGIGQWQKHGRSYANIVRTALYHIGWSPKKKFRSISNLMYPGRSAMGGQNFNPVCNRQPVRPGRHITMMQIPLFTREITHAFVFNALHPINLPGCHRPPGKDIPGFPIFNWQEGADCPLEATRVGILPIEFILIDDIYSLWSVLGNEGCTNLVHTPNMRYIQWIIEQVPSNENPTLICCDCPLHDIFRGHILAPDRRTNLIHDLIGIRSILIR